MGGVLTCWGAGHGPTPVDVDAQMALLPMNAGRRRGTPGWQVDPGTYRVLVGRSSADIVHEVEVEVEVTVEAEAASTPPPR